MLIEIDSRRDNRDTAIYAVSAKNLLNLLRRCNDGCYTLESMLHKPADDQPGKRLARYQIFGALLIHRVARVYYRSARMLRDVQRKLIAEELTLTVYDIGAPFDDLLYQLMVKAGRNSNTGIYGKWQRADISNTRLLMASRVLGKGDDTYIVAFFLKLVAKVLYGSHYTVRGDSV